MAQKKRNLLPLTPADPPKEESKPERKAITGVSQIKASDLEGARKTAAKVIQADNFANDDQILEAVIGAGYSVEGLDTAAIEEIREENGVKVIKPSGWVSRLTDGEWAKTGRRLNPSGARKAAPSGKRRGRPPGSGKAKASGDVATKPGSSKGTTASGWLDLLAAVQVIQGQLKRDGLASMTIPVEGLPSAH